MRASFLVLACFTVIAHAEAVPFQLNSNKIYLPVKVNGQGPFSFILDTGAIYSVVDAECAASLKIATSGKSEMHGAGEGWLPSSTGKDVDLSADGAALQNQQVEVVPINRAVSFSEGRTVNGLLGCPFFERFIVEIDYANNEINFHSPETFQYVGRAEAIPLQLERENMFIRANIVLPNGNRVAGRFIVDTGWRVALSFTSAFAREQKLSGMTPTVLATTGVGIGGPVIDAVGRIRALEIGPYTIKNPVTDFPPATGGILAQTDFAGIIGGEILRRFNVILDYPHRRMWLQPNAHFEEAYDFDMSGIYLSAEGGNFRTFKIFRIIPKSPADAAGLREGDQILSIDKELTAKFTLDHIRQIFRQAGKTYSLEIIRGNNRIQTNLTTRRLI